MRIDHPTEAALPGLRLLWKQAFGDTDAFLDLFFSLGYAPNRCLCAADGDRVAAAMHWLDGSCRGRKIAYVYAVATDKAYRGQGLCRKLTEQAHRVLRERGYSGAVLVPAEPGLFEMYGKLGYRGCSSVREWASVAGDALPLTELSAEEYARLRRDLLPEGAVVQEGPVLDLLGAMGKFYGGPGILLTAIREENRLWVPELLGDPSYAPGILAALGAAEGKFRGPGTEQPFAMYCPLDEAPAPTYLGFALD